MRPRDWFSVGVRLFGVYVFFEGFAQLIAFVCGVLGLFTRVDFSSDQSERYSKYVLAYVVGYFALSYFLVFGAERLTSWAFHEPSPDDDSADKPE